MMNLCMPLLKGESAADKIGPTYPFLRIKQQGQVIFYPHMAIDFIHNIVRLNNDFATFDVSIHDENGGVVDSIHMPLCTICGAMFGWGAIAPSENIALFDLSPLINLDNVVIPLEYPNTPTSPRNYDFYANYFRFGLENNAQGQCSLSFMTSCIDGRPNASKSELVALLNRHMSILAKRWGSFLFKDVSDYAFFTESNTIEPNHFSGGIFMTQQLPVLTDRYYRFYAEDETYTKPGYTQFSKVITLKDTNSVPLLTGPYSNVTAMNPFPDQDDLVLYLSLLKEDCLDDALRKLNTRYFKQ